MPTRLTRSRTDLMFAGVCGGLGEYFGIDPVIVRFIFVILTLTSGLGVPVYIVLWMITPKAAPPQSVYDPRATPAFDQQQQGTPFANDAREVLISQQMPQSQQRTATPWSASPAQQRPAAPWPQPPEPSSYRYDPLTGQPLQPDQPATGKTVYLSQDQQIQQSYQQQLPPTAPAPGRRRGNWRNLGISLTIVGGLILLNQLNIDLDFVFPLVLIVAGIVMMRRK